MRLFFRPMLKPTIWVLPVFLLLIGLGTWQVHRLHWKVALLAKMNENLSGPPLPLDAILKLPAEQAQYHRVALNGRFENAKEAYAFGTDSDGKPAYHVLTPLILGDGRALIVDRGIVPQDKRDPQTRTAGELKGEQHVVGVWRTPDPPNLFTPKAEPAQRLWFARDVTAIAALDHVTLVAPVVVEADSTPNPGGLPKGGQTVIDLPNNHLQYAITWYLMALGLLAVYLAYHRQKGRLGNAS